MRRRDTTAGFGGSGGAVELDRLEGRMLLSGVTDKGADSMSLATDLGLVPTYKTLRVLDAVGAGDASDWFKVRLDRIATLNIDVTTGASIRLIKDVDADQRLDAGETLEQGAGAQSWFHWRTGCPLRSGTYYVQIYTPADSYSYQLYIWTDALADAGGGSFRRPTELGTNPPEYRATTLVEPAGSDWYGWRQTTNRAMEFTLSSAQGVAARLFKDVNGDNVPQASEEVAAVWQPVADAAMPTKRVNLTTGPGRYLLYITSTVQRDSGYSLDILGQGTGQGELERAEVIDGAHDLFPQAWGLLEGGGDTAVFQFYLSQARRVLPRAFFNAIEGVNDGGTTWSDPGIDPIVELIQDRNSNGAVDEGEVLARTTGGESPLVATMPKGNYYLRVSSPGGVAMPFSIVQYFPMNLPAEMTAMRTALEWVDARHVGGLYRQRDTTFSGLLPAGGSHFYSMRFWERAGIGATLARLSENANVQILRDANGNGRFDDADVLAGSYRGGIKSDRVGAVLESGVYFLRVYSTGAATSYELNVTAAAAPASDPGNTVAQAYGEDYFPGQRGPYIEGLSGSADHDLYRMVVHSARNIVFGASSLMGDVDLRLYRDANGNGVLETGELLASSANPGITLDSVSADVAAGNYYLDVFTLGAGPAAYRLTIGG